MRRIAIPVLIGLAVAACSAGANGQSGGQTTGTKEIFGTILGGIGGAVAGSQFGSGTGQLAATAAGTLLGAFIGNSVGASLDRADQMAMSRSTQHTLETLPSGHTGQWRNPDSGHWGTVTPQRTYQMGGGYCREFTQTVVVGSQAQEAYGTACRQPDGSWKIQQ